MSPPEAYPAPLLEVLARLAQLQGTSFTSRKRKRRIFHEITRRLRFRLVKMILDHALAHILNERSVSYALIADFYDPDTSTPL